ncbi:MAG: molybdopterin-dependent oxidoreductase [Rhodospirillales bacterium]
MKVYRTLFAVLIGMAPVAGVAADAAPQTSGNACAGGYAKSFKVKGAVTSAKTITLGALRALPQATLDVTYFSGRSGLVSEAYTGPTLYQLLEHVGIATDPAQKNDILRKSVVITASDCYQVVVSLGELLPTFGGSQPVLVAWGDGTGKPLPEDEGMARLVVPGDKAGGRYVSNIVRIVVRNPGPAPQGQ